MLRVIHFGIAASSYLHLWYFSMKYVLIMLFAFPLFASHFGHSCIWEYFVFTDAKNNSIAPGSMSVSVYFEDGLNIPHLHSYVLHKCFPEGDVK